MLYLISTCMKNFREVIEKNVDMFFGQVHVNHVPDDECVFVRMQTSYVYTELFIVYTIDCKFIDKLADFGCEFQCLHSKHLNSKNVSLYRFVGTREQSYYKEILDSISCVEYTMIDNIATFCRKNTQCCNGIGLIWIESIKSSDSFGSRFMQNFQKLYTLQRDTLPNPIKLCTSSQIFAFLVVCDDADVDKKLQTVCNIVQIRKKV